MKIKLSKSLATLPPPAEVHIPLGWKDSDRGLYAFFLLEYAPRGLLSSADRRFIDTAVLFIDRPCLTPKQAKYFDDLVLRFEQTIELFNPHE